MCSNNTLCLPKIDVKFAPIHDGKISREKLPTIEKMSTRTALKAEARFLGLPKNRTGLFAADTIHEVRPTRTHLINVPALSPQFRQNGSMNILLASAEQNRHQLQQYNLSSKEIQQFYIQDENLGTKIDSSNDSRVTNNGIRNGFRPWPVRQQRMRLNTAASQRSNQSFETRDATSKSTLVQPPASAKFRSEIVHLNQKLLKKRNSNKSLRLQTNQESEDSPRSALSYATSQRISSASTQLTADRIHQRFSSAISRFTANTRPTLNSIHNQTPQLPADLVAASPPLTIRETDEKEEPTIDEPPTHAYQIPQQSNVGSESVFLADPASISSIKTRSAKNIRRPSDSKSLSCPFYVMYFTNLAMQQQQQRQTKEPNGIDDENERLAFAASSTIRKVPVNSRTSTAHAKRSLNRRQVNSPISTQTFSTNDDDDRTTTTTSIPQNKRFTTRISPMTENNQTHSLRDILRTSSLNHVQV